MILFICIAVVFRDFRKKVKVILCQAMWSYLIKDSPYSKQLTINKDKRGKKMGENTLLSNSSFQMQYPFGVITWMKSKIWKATFITCIHKYLWQFNLKIPMCSGLYICIQQKGNSACISAGIMVWVINSVFPSKS